MEGIITVEIENDETGILVSKKIDGKSIKQTYALNDEHANWIREQWLDESFGLSNDEIINQLCCS